MVKAPRSITIGSKTFEVKQNPELSLREGTNGCCIQSTLTIEIDQTILPAYKTSTLMHEAVEAINQIWLANSLSHEDIERLGEALAQVLQSMGVDIDWS